LSPSEKRARYESALARANSSLRAARELALDANNFGAEEDLLSLTFEVNRLLEDSLKDRRTSAQLRLGWSLKAPGAGSPTP
jgi:hypothetical protein